jgi:hypothetical protein
MANETMTLRRATRARMALFAMPLRRRRGVRCATGAFVERLLEQRGVIPTALRPLQMTLRAVGRGGETTLTNLTAGIDLRLAFTTVLTPATRSRSRGEPMSAWLPVPSVAVTSETAESPVSRLLERILSREQRVEVAPAPLPASPAFSAPDASPLSPTRPPATPSSGRSELVVRRSVVVLPPTHAEGAAEPSVLSPRSEPMRGRPATGVRPAAGLTIPLSSSELTRLTDDVLRVLDSRVVAHRERRGAI